MIIRLKLKTFHVDLIKHKETEVWIMGLKVLVERKEEWSWTPGSEALQSSTCSGLAIPWASVVLQKHWGRDFLVGPRVEITQCTGLGFSPWSGDSDATCHRDTKTRNKAKLNKQLRKEKAVKEVCHWQSINIAGLTLQNLPGLWKCFWRH